MEIFALFFTSTFSWETAKQVIIIYIHHSEDTMSLLYYIYIHRDREQKILNLVLFITLISLQNSSTRYFAHKFEFSIHTCFQKKKNTPYIST